MFWLACTSTPVDSGPVVVLDSEIPGDSDPHETEQIGGQPELLSHERGVYTEPFELVLDANVRDAEIRYSTDGSDPVLGTVYTEPLLIEATTALRVGVYVGTETALGPEAHTYLFPETVVNQVAHPGYPDEWWTEHETGPWPADYTMDPEISLDPAVFTALPIISLVLPPDDLFFEGGIHENSLEKGDDWERATSLELFWPDGTVLAEGCGVQIHGGSGRNPSKTPKKSFRLVFKSDFGPGELDFAVFEDESAVQSFDTLVLRGRYNRSWTHFDKVQRDRSQYLREEFATSLQAQMGQPATHTRHAHLFLNGLYWGLYLIQERPDEHFHQDYFGLPEAEWDVLNQGEVVAGDLQAWEELQLLADADLSIDGNYQAVASRIELEGFVDYVLLQLYLGNIDWPDRNWYASRHRSDEGVWRFYAWDAELTMVATDSNYIEYIDDAGSPGALFTAMRANEEFRALVAERAKLHIGSAGAPLAPHPLGLTWSALSEAVVPGAQAESARWGDHLRDDRGVSDAELYTYDEHWKTENARIADEYIPARRDEFLADLEAAGLY